MSIKCQCGQTFKTISDFYLHCQIHKHLLNHRRNSIKFVHAFDLTDKNTARKIQVNKKSSSYMSGKYRY